MHKNIKAECEFDLGVGYISWWDSKEDAEEFFKGAFNNFQTEVVMSYEEAIKDGLLSFTEENIKGKQ